MNVRYVSSCVRGRLPTCVCLPVGFSVGLLSNNLSARLSIKARANASYELKYKCTHTLHDVWL